MALQERGTRIWLPPSAERARINDLINKVRCWEGHIRIAQGRGDLRQIRFGEVRLNEIKSQISDSIRLK